MAGLGSHGGAGPGSASQGAARLALHGKAWPGKALHGVARQAGLGGARRGAARLGAARFGGLVMYAISAFFGRRYQKTAGHAVRLYGRTSRET